MGRRGFVLDGLGLVAVIVLAFDINLIDISRRCSYISRVVLRESVRLLRVWRLL